MNYKDNFLDWLELTWYLISEPWIKLYNLFLDDVVPKWYIYLLFSYKLKHMKECGKQQNIFDWIEAVRKKHKITDKQANRLIKLTKKIPEHKIREAYTPDPDKMFE